MPTFVKLPDGTLVSLPDAPEAKPSMFDELLTGAKKVGADIVSGYGKAVGGALTSSRSPESIAMEEKASGKKVDLGFLDQAGQNTKKFWEEVGAEQGQSPGFAKSMTQGAAGALVTPVAQKGHVLQSLIAQAIGGASGAAGSKAAEKFFPENPTYQSIAGLLSGAIGGGVTAPKQSVAKADIRRSLNGTTPEQFAAAERQAQQFRDVGSTTHTAAEAFPEGSGIMALAHKARGGPLDNQLRTQTQLRPEDLRALGETSMNRVGPAVDPNTVANQTAGAATGAMENMNQLATNAMTNRLQGEMASPAGVRSLQQDLRLAAKQQDRPNVRDAYSDIADALTSARKTPSGGPQPIVPVQELSFALKSLKDQAANPLAVNKSGKSITSSDYREALGAAEQGLGDLSPAFKEGNADFQAFKQGPTAEMRTGPIGSLADKNPLLAGQTPIARLEALLQGNTPQTVGGTARTLATPELTKGQSVAPTDIARALMQNKLRGGSTDPGQTIRGMEGSQIEQNLSALIGAGGGNSAHSLAPLAAADKLQSFASPAGINEMPGMQLRQLALRPFRTLDMMTTGRTESAIQREIASILASQDPAAIQRLREIAMFNPDIRKAITAMSAINGAEEK